MLKKGFRRRTYASLLATTHYNAVAFLIIVKLGLLVLFLLLLLDIVFYFLFN